MSYLYALRHKPTDRYLPHERGGSFAEPTEPNKKPPRFFHRVGDAKGFLTNWLQGPMVRDFSIDIYTGTEECVGLKHDPSYAEEPRIPEDWEVVKILWSVIR